MKTLEELRRWAHSAPAGTMLSAAAIAAVLEQLEAEPTAAEMSGETPLPWQVLLWTCDPEVRIGREELLEAVGRPASWLYRHTSTKASPRIPHRKLDGSLTFVVGEVRRWILDREEIVEAGPMERPRLRALIGGR